MSKSSRQAWALLPLSFGVGCVIALIQANGSLEKGSIIALVSLGTLFFLVAVKGLGWLKAPYPIGIPIRLLVWLTVICGGMTTLGAGVWPKPKPPKIITLGFEIILFNPGQPPFANVFFQNVGGEGKVVIYSSAGLALASADPSEIGRELTKTVDKVVSEGGGIVYTIGSQERKWFSVMGPSLTSEQAESLKNGTHAFYFRGAVVNNDGSRNYDFCNFVVGNRPNVVLQCPE